MQIRLKPSQTSTDIFQILQSKLDPDITATENSWKPAAS